jgi:hypothetical protein
LYGRAGRLTAKNGGFRPGQVDVARCAGTAEAQEIAAMPTFQCFKQGQAAHSLSTGAGGMSPPPARTLTRTGSLSGADQQRLREFVRANLLQDGGGGARAEGKIHRVGRKFAS